MCYRSVLAYLPGAQSFNNARVAGKPRCCVCLPPRTVHPRGGEACVKIRHRNQETCPPLFRLAACVRSTHCLNQATRCARVGCVALTCKTGVVRAGWVAVGSGQGGTWRLGCAGQGVRVPRHARTRTRTHTNTHTNTNMHNHPTPLPKPQAWGRAWPKGESSWLPTSASSSTRTPHGGASCVGAQANST